VKANTLADSRCLIQKSKYIYMRCLFIDETPEIQVYVKLK